MFTPRPTYLLIRAHIKLIANKAYLNVTVIYNTISYVIYNTISFTCNKLELAQSGLTECVAYKENFFITLESDI